MTSRFAFGWPSAECPEIAVKSDGSLRRRNKDQAGGRSLLQISWCQCQAPLSFFQITATADIADGPHRTPKGLRHAYGINAIGKGVPLNILQKWLGHAQLTTTAIYANAVGKEESELAARMWDQ